MEDYIKQAIKRICLKKRVENSEKIKQIENQCLMDYRQNNYKLCKFKKTAVYFDYNHKKRLFFHYGNGISTEKVVIKAVCGAIENKTNSKPKNKKYITSKLFEAIKKLDKNFTIVVFDMKNFFESVSTQYCYESYIKNLELCDEMHNIAKKYVSLFPYCVQGVALSNVFANIAANELDEKIKASLADFDVLFYGRFVDDGYIVLNKFVDEKDIFEKIINCVKQMNIQSKNLGIKFNNKLKLNLKKFKCISNKQLGNFCCLGYEFFVDNNGISIGISKQKQTDIENKIKRLISQNYTNQNKLRILLKFNCQKICYSKTLGEKKIWFKEGLIEKYELLKCMSDKIESGTKCFFENLYVNCFNSLNLEIPKYLKCQDTDNGFNLYYNLIKQKTTTIDKECGIKKEKLISYLKQLETEGEYECDYEKLANRFLSFFV